MKIVSTPLNDRYLGIQKCCSLFCTFYRWEPTQKPIFDVLEEIEPDVIFIDLKYAFKTVIDALNEYPSIKIVLFGEGVPNNIHPDVVCCKPSVSELIRKHLESGDHSTLYIKDYADIMTYWDGHHDRILESDIAYYSNHGAYQEPIQKIETLSMLSKLARLKIAGPVKIPLPNYVGSIKEHRVMSFLKSSKITIDWGGTELLNHAANGIFTISTMQNDLFPYFTDNLDSNIDMVSSFLDKPKARKNIAKKAQDNILKQDTCFHRVHDIFDALYDSELAQKPIQYLEDSVCVGV